MAKEPGKHHHKGGKGDHKKPKSGKEEKGDKKHSHSEHKKKHSKSKSLPTSSGEEMKTPPTSPAEEPTTATDVPTTAGETSGSETESPSDVEAGRGKKTSWKPDKSLVFMPEVKDAPDNSRDLHPVGRFCILLGSFALMAGMIYLVMQVYQWVGRSEKIFGSSGPVPDAAKNPAASSITEAYNL